ncbi:hypothetical protein [Sphingomonas panacis]|uniref:hypothetical protein n=1 Tax=Sphingomonas panacis TaxID=1560345 RepID=UPI003B845CFA
MAMLSRDHELRLQSLNIGWICHRRRPSERNAEPTTWHRQTGSPVGRGTSGNPAGYCAALSEPRTTFAMPCWPCIRICRVIMRRHPPRYSAIAPTVICQYGTNRSAANASQICDGASGALIVSTLQSRCTIRILPTVPSWSVRNFGDHRRLAKGG